jgi:hypothetical protein
MALSTDVHGVLGPMAAGGLVVSVCPLSGLRLPHGSLTRLNLGFGHLLGELDRKIIWVSND